MSECGPARKLVQTPKNGTEERFHRFWRSDERFVDEQSQALQDACQPMPSPQTSLRRVEVTSRRRKCSAFETATAPRERGDHL